MLKDPKLCLSIIENAAESMIVVDKDSRIFFQNPEAHKVFGFEDNELIGRSVLEMLHHHYPDGSPVPKEQCKVYRAVAYGETARDFTWMLTRKDGRKIFASCSCSPLYIQDEQVGAIFFATDMTARKKAEEALADAVEKLHLASDVAGVGYYDYYPQTNELIWSGAIKKHFGLPEDAPVTRDTFFANIHPEDRERIRAAIDEAFKPENGGKFQYEYRSVGQEDGKIRWLISMGQVFFENGVPVRQIGATVDVTERKEIEENMRRAAQHDPLTGLPNRALLTEYTEHLFAMAERDDAECAVLFIDLDRFKPINDLYGHGTGDKVLQEIANRLRMVTRKEDIVSRLGGDEFVVVLPHINNATDPQTVAQHILNKINRSIKVNGVEVSVSPSIGISVFPKHGKHLDTLIRCADTAMYDAKHSGKNTFKTYIPGNQEKANSELELEMHLKHAIDTNRLALFYQPIMDMQSGQLVGVEALLRMIGMKGDLLLPDQFIPIAETAGLIDKIGQWVVNEACRQHDVWRADGMPTMIMSINVSSLEFRQQSFATYLREAIERYDMDPRCLQIELTESAVMDNLAEAVTTLQEIRSLGVHIALDDFGTGYSSLSYLSTLPLDKLKIDQSFIRKLDTNTTNQAITDTIIGLGRLMNLEVIGEGIESEPALEYLRERGCDQAQGFLFSKPLPAHELEAWYHRQPSRLH